MHILCDEKVDILVFEAVFAEPRVLDGGKHQDLRHQNSLFFGLFAQLYDYFEPINAWHMVVENNQFEIQGVHALVQHSLPIFDKEKVGFVDICLCDQELLESLAVDNLVFSYQYFFAFFVRSFGLGHF